MGCVVSMATKPLNSPNRSSKDSAKSHGTTVIFKVLPSETEAREIFENDGTLIKNSDADHLALRTMLEEPYSQNALGKFAAKTQSLDLFMCWIDIQEYKTIPTDSYRRSKALHIYHKYIDLDAPLMLSMTESERKHYEHLIQISKTNPMVLTPQCLDGIQSKCFIDMYYNIYVPFKQTEEFHLLTLHLKQKYNRVKFTDFEYYNKLGEGGFGFVVHCKKKSTGKHFAMKIQTKQSLLSFCHKDLSKINTERDAFASLHHPFIVNLNYAFQTPSLVMMVLDLADCGDLDDSCKASPTMRLSLERVRFYAAEIILALSYLHQCGLVYRDLKPQNVLLNSDGHIQLADLGGVLDDGGVWFDSYRAKQNHVVPLFGSAKENSPKDPALQEKMEHHDSKLAIKTPQGVMGTLGYMAPEMVLMLNKTKLDDIIHQEGTKTILSEGYTQAVDWWSLGITIYKLLTGQLPFSSQKNYEFIEISDETIKKTIEENVSFHEYIQLFQPIYYPPFLTKDTQDFITHLLDVNQKTRLGRGTMGILEIKNHHFFHTIDWDLLEQKQIEPPFKPGDSMLNNIDLEPMDFTSLLTYYDKESLLENQPSIEDQKYFENWDFIAPHTLRIEAGLSQMMGQLVRNMKARQLIGNTTYVRPPDHVH